MMHISTAVSTNATGTTTQPFENPEKKVSSDYETFLKMLTVQMKNQDPLNPVDSSDYASQLATFSGVEQQVRTNDLLEALGQKVGLTGLSQFAGWVGMEARVAAPAYFNGAPITINAKPVTTADKAYLTVSDSSGTEVYRVLIGGTGGKMAWAGVGSNGQPLPSGLYQFNVESYANDALISTDVAQVYSRITEAKSEDGETVLVLEGGVEVSADEITAIR